MTLHNTFNPGLRSFSLLALLFWGLVSLTTGVQAQTKSSIPQKPQIQSQEAPNRRVPTLEELLALHPNEAELHIDDQILPADKLRSYVARKNQSLGTKSSLHDWATKWTGGRVPYVYDASMSAGKKAIFEEACREWEQFANLRFTPRVSEANYITVASTANESNSYIGMIGGSQTLNLADWANKYTAVHEIAHALGIIHEQSRAGRDTYVTINTANIQAGMEHNFTIVDGSLNQGDYDFDSIMHYPATAFSTNGQPTITANAGYTQFQNTMGQRNQTSTLDASGMAQIYGPPQRITLVNPGESGTFADNPTLRATTTYAEPTGSVEFAARPLDTVCNRTPNIAISPNSTSTHTDSASTVVSGNVVNATLTVDIDHTWRGDLKLTLITPDNTRLLVQPATGISGSNLKTSYDLSTSLAGKPIAGTYTLEVQDTYPDDGGTWNSWSLTFSQPYVAIATDSDGANAQGEFTALWDTTALEPGQYQVRAKLVAGLFSTQDTNTADFEPDTNNAPTDIALSASSVNENQPSGTAIGTLSTTDADTSDAHTYSFAAGAGDTDNALFAIDGNTLKTAQAFDYETQTTYSVRIQTNDGNGGTFSKSFTIVVNDLDDTPPTFAIDDVGANEGNSGTTNLTFTISLSKVSAQTTSVNYATANGTALQPGDYSHKSGTLTFAPGETTKTIDVPIVGDYVIEANETFTVNLSNAVNAVITDVQGTGTITNDDNDTTPPTVRFTTSATTPAGTTPVPSGIVNGALPVITGEAADGGSGILKVLLRLYRSKTGGGLEYWNGTAWVSSAVYLTTTLNPSGGGASVSWSYSNVPAGANLADGTYYLAVTAYDKANKVTSTSSSFNRVTDNELPTVRFTTSATTPAGTTPVPNGTIYGTLPVITGEAADAGSGIVKVLLRLYRPKTGGGLEYWNGSAWVSSVVYLTTTLNPSGGGANVSWSKGSGWPTDTNLADGTYYLAVTAYDKANKVAAASTSFKKVADTDNPAVSFTTSATTPAGTTPTSSSTITGAIPTITGQASDGGSGILKVLLRLYRPKTGGGLEYWNGSAWVSSVVYLTTTLNPSGGGANVSWSYSNVPAGANLNAGTYYIAVTAYDKVNKTAAASSSFQRASTGAPAPTSTATLTGAEAWGSNGSVRLTFSEDLNSASAQNVTHYRAYLNTVLATGQTVPVNSAAYDRATRTVTLLFTPGSIQAEDTLQVNWSLLDSNGAPVTGVTNLQVH